MMKWVLAAALLTTVQAAATPLAQHAPHRIISLKLCTDALLLDLVPPPLSNQKNRIASVTFLAQEPQMLRQWPQAAHLAVNHGSLEEVLNARPDLVLTDSFTPPDTLAMLKRSGARVVTVPPAEDFAAIRNVTRLVAAAVGEQARGEMLIAQMDATLRDVAAHRPARPITVAAWGGGGFVPGAGSLFDAALGAAGGRNMERGAFGYYDAETLLAAKPDVLAYGDDYANSASLRREQDLNPALMARYENRRITYPSALLGCGVPQSAQAARALQRSLAAVMQ